MEVKAVLDIFKHRISSKKLVSVKPTENRECDDEGSQTPSSFSYLTSSQVIDDIFSERGMFGCGLMKSYDRCRRLRKFRGSWKVEE